MQIAVPKAMVNSGKNKTVSSYLENHTIGIKPSIGTSGGTKELLKELFHRYRKPMVIDADALNLIACNEELKPLIPPKSILAPHPAEFDRLLGHSSPNSRQCLLSAIVLARE